MQKIEYLDPEIANEGQRADAAWVPSPKPHVWDYAPLKEHPHYGQYFAAKPFKEWPAMIYNHKTGEEKIVGDAKTAAQYGVSYNRNTRFPQYVCDGDWKDEPRTIKPDLHAGGKSLVTANATQAANTTAETMAEILKRLIEGKAAPEIATAVSQDKEYQDYLAFKRMQAAQTDPAATPIVEAAEPMPSDAEQKAILVGLAEEREIKVDKRWSLERLKAELDRVA